MYNVIVGWVCLIYGVVCAYGGGWESAAHMFLIALLFFSQWEVSELEKRIEVLEKKK